MAEIVPVVSEALEAQVRNLLPSQRGFGEDLQASNVIMPIIDLTPAAEGTTVPEYQQQALAFGSQTSFSAVNSSATIANTPGFYRVFGVSTLSSTSVTNFRLTDGLTSKIIWQHQQVTAGSSTNEFNFVVFLAAGESLTGASNSANAVLAGSSRQIADVNGNAVNPSGFTPQ